MFFVKHKSTCLIFLLLPIFNQLSIAQCEDTCIPLAYEGFEYPDNTALHTLPGGSGWNGTWQVQNNNISVPGYHVEDSDALMYHDLQAFGNGLAGGSTYLSAGRYLDNSVDGAFADYVENSSISRNGTTLWMSAILNKKQNNEEEVTLDLHNNIVSWANGSEQVGFGYYGANSDQVGMRYWTLALFGNYYLTAIPIDYGTPTMMVFRIEFGANDEHTFSLWVNPAATSLGDMPPTATISQTVINPLHIISLRTAVGFTTNNAAIDEIRFGTTYRCVTPDANTLLNRQPVASFTTDTTSGMLPFTVNFNATASFDPDVVDNIVSYEWEFGDGQEGTGEIISHTYEFTGQMQAILTVTDQCGANHGFSVPIFGYDTNGDFSCLSTISLVQMASYQQANGILSIQNGTNFRLTDSEANTIEQTGTIFNNLAAGDYTLAITGNGGCVDSFNITIPTDSTTISGWSPDPCVLELGINVDGVPYWNTVRVFKDFKKNSSNFFTGNTDFTGAWNTGYMDEIAVDAQGYPLELPYQPSGEVPPQKVRCVYSANGSIPLGDFLFLYEGEGEINFAGNLFATDVQPGRIAFTVTGGDNFYFEIEESQLGNHIRNIRIIRAEHEFNYESEPFYEYFLDRVNRFSTLRFMDWGHTNNSTLVNWSDRNPKDFHTQGEHIGVAYEWMIDLCNKLKKDIWICVPHAATDDYIQEMARLFRDNLDPELTIYLEYSNEVWNWQFQQAHWVEAWRPAHWNQQRAFGERCRLIFEAWHEEFGMGKDRVKRVVGTQAVVPALAESAMAQVKEFDYLSPTWYFGYGGDCGDNLWALGEDATVEQILACSREGLTFQASLLRQQHRNAKLYGADVIEYEGGQHMTSNPYIPPFQDSLYAAQIAPGIYDIYADYIDSLRLWDSKLAVHFTLASVRESQFGSWGALETIEQDWTTQRSYKWDALMDNMACYEPPVNVVMPDKPYESNCATELLVLDNPTTATNCASLITSAERLESGDAIVYQANESITLKPGFIAEAGVDFVAQIQGENCCTVENIVEDIPEQQAVVRQITINPPTILQPDLKVYPNPFNEQLFVKYELPTEGMISLYLTDMLGQSIQALLNQEAKSTGRHTFQVQGLDLLPGTYFLILQTKESMVSRKLITLKK